MIKGLLYVYFVYDKFTIDFIKFTIDENDPIVYSGDDVIQMFEVEKCFIDSYDKFFDYQKGSYYQYDTFYLPRDLNLEKIVNRMFNTTSEDDYFISQIIMNSLMNMISAHSSNLSKFNFSYSAFECIAGAYQNLCNGRTLNPFLSKLEYELEDFKKIKNDDFRLTPFEALILEKWSDPTITPLPYTNLYFSNISTWDIGILDIRTNLRSFYEANNSLDTQKLIDFMSRYNDDRIIEYFNNFIKTSIIFDDMDTEDKPLLDKTGSKDDFEMARFVLIKYANFLRNQYFHGARHPYAFVLKNDTYNVMNKLADPLIVMTLELILVFINEVDSDNLPFEI